MKSKYLSICTLIAFLVSFLPLRPLYAAATDFPQAQATTIIVELTDAPVLASMPNSAGNAKIHVAAATTAAATTQLQKEQTAALSKISALCQSMQKPSGVLAKGSTKGIQPLYHYTHVFNGFSITVPKNAVDKIAALPEIRAVYPVTHYPFTPMNHRNNTTPLYSHCCEDIHVNQLHQENIRGQGQAIAVIDSELDWEHACFAGEVATPALSKQYIQQLLHNNALNIDISEDINKIYHSSKLPLVYNYANHSSQVFSTNPSMIHGSHVSGIACGRNGTLSNGDRFDGVAPEAQLVFMSIVGNDTLTLDDNAILAAIDDAAKLQVDAINISFGIPYIDTRSPAAKALNTAKNAGIFLSVAAGNTSRGDIESNATPAILPSLIDYPSLGQPANYSACTTVASCNQRQQLSKFSSWGSTTALDLKPEITAPGENIYSAIPSNSSNKNTYDFRSGTSMATPHITGSAALLKQYIEAHPEKYPALDARQLHCFIENLMMSTATILPNKENPAVSASPRQQGAGRIHLVNAIKTPAVLIGPDGKTKLSLKDSINQQTRQFTLACTAYNFGPQPITYDQLQVTVLSDAINKKGTIGGMQPLATTSIALPEQIVVPANAKVPVTATITLDSRAVKKQLQAFSNGFFVDGFLTLSSHQQDVPAIHIPYSGFYGNWTKAPALDQPNYSGHSQLNGTFLASTVDVLNETYTLGSNTLFESFLNGQTSYNKVAEEAYCALSPNNDGWGDSLSVTLKTLRNASIERISIYNSSGKEIYHLQHPTNVDGKLSTNNTVQLAAGSALQSQPDGPFTVKVSGKLRYPGAHTETIQMKFYTDRVAPTLSHWHYQADQNNTEVSFHAADNTALMGVLIDGQRLDTNAYESMVCTTEALDDIHQGDFHINLSQYIPESISITVFDYALNRLCVYGPDATPFMDVHPTDWYYDAIYYTKAQGLMSGLDEKRFGPNNGTDRAQFVTTLWRLAGSPMDAPMPNYSDLAVKSYYTPAVAWASQAHLISGYPDGRFGPNDPLTREQMATIFYRFASYQQHSITPIDNSVLRTFSDAKNVQPWAKSALCWAIETGLMRGTDPTHLTPQGRTTRAQLATVLTHYHQKEVSS